MKNKIGWCNITWNPVWGCKNNCEYCYARAIAKRFWNQMYRNEFNYYYKKHPGWIWTGDPFIGLQHFKPTFLESQFGKKFPKKPQRIFVGSMSEIAHWEKRWVEVILGRILCYPQHIFQFLTRHPDVYLNFNFPKNCWLGITVTSAKNYNYYDSGCDDSSIHLAYQKFKISNPDNLKFICFEPLLNEISIDLENINWVILGAETGGRKDKVFAKRSWIESILINCYKKGIPVYIKDSITKWQPQLKKFKGFPEVR